MLRDTGCTTVCISTKFASEINSQNQQERLVSLANGTECLCHEVEVELESPYISGKVTALTMDCPFADDILGESAFVKKEKIAFNNADVSRMDSSNRGKSDNLVVDSKRREDTRTGSIITETDDTISSVETRNMKMVREIEEDQNNKIEKEYLQERDDNLNQREHSMVKYDTNRESSLNLEREQQSDPTLKRVRELAGCNDKDKEETYFFYRNGIVYRHFKMQNKEVIEQIVLPKRHREHVMHIAHDVPLGGALRK